MEVWSNTYDQKKDIVKEALIEFNVDWNSPTTQSQTFGLQFFALTNQICENLPTESRQGTADSRTFDPINESADSWSAGLFHYQSKKMLQTKNILIGQEETNNLACSFIKFLGNRPL